MSSHTLVLALTATLYACSSSATEPDLSDLPPATELPAYLEAVRGKYDLPALGALVLRGDEVIALDAVGVRKRGDKTPVSKDDLWHLGSCTKAMTATLVAELVERGVVGWDSTLSQVLPELALDPAFASVTLTELLLHRGGAPSEFDLDRWRKRTDSLVVQRREFVAQLLARPPTVARGRVVYSNAGYIIVGAVLEALTGQSWEQLMEERLFAPLGMTSCGFGAPGTSAKLDQPRGHAGKRAYEPGPGADNPPLLGPAGTVHCSLPDWSRFVAAHLAGARGQGGLVSAATFQHLQARDEGADLRYALGWGAADTKFGAAVLAFGSNTLWFSGVTFVPSLDLAVLTATNVGVGDAGRSLDHVIDDLLAAYR